MKKVVSVVALAVIAGGLIAPKFAGDSFQQNLDNYVAQFDKVPYYKAEMVTREQGWFSSFNEIKISLDFNDMMKPGAGPESAPSDMPEKIEFIVPIRSQHGPVLTQSGFSLGWIDWNVVFESIDDVDGVVFTPMTTDAPVYKVNGNVSLGGAFSYVDNFSGLVLTNENEPDTTITFRPWSGKGNFTADKSVYAGSGLSMVVNEAGEDVFTMSDMKVSMDANAGYMQIIEQQLYDGVFGFEIDSIDIDAGDVLVALNGFSMDIESALDDETGLATLSASNKLTSFATKDLALDNIRLDYELANLTQEFFVAYQEFNQKMMATPENFESLMTEFMQSNMLELLKGEPEFNFPIFSVDINDSNINGFLNTKMVGVTELPETLEDPAFWMMHTLIDSKMVMQEEAALFVARLSLKQQIASNPQFAGMSEAEINNIVDQQVEPTLVALVQQGLLTKTDEGYEMTFSMEKGAANLNGNPIPLPM